MTETQPKRRWFSFSIRDLLWLTALVAVSVGVVGGSPIAGRILFTNRHIS